MEGMPKEWFDNFTRHWLAQVSRNDPGSLQPGDDIFKYLTTGRYTMWLSYSHVPPEPPEEPLFGAATDSREAASSSQVAPQPVQPAPTTDIPQDGESSGQASAEGYDEFELGSDEEAEVSSDSFDPDDYRDAPGEGARGSSPAGRLQGSCPEGSHPPPAYTPPPPAARGTPATASETGIPRHSGSSNVASSPRPVSTAAVAAEPAAGFQRPWPPPPPPGFPVHHPEPGWRPPYPPGGLDPPPPLPEQEPPQRSWRPPPQPGRSGPPQRPPPPLPTQAGLGAEPRPQWGPNRAPAYKPPPPRRPRPPEETPERDPGAARPPGGQKGRTPGSSGSKGPTVVEHNATAGAFHVHPGRDMVHGSWAGDIVHGRDLALVSPASTAHFRRAGQHALLHQVVSCRADGTTEITQRREACNPYISMQTASNAAVMARERPLLEFSKRSIIQPR